jgi:hypothetical protein
MLPGDLILSRYMPDASAEEREEARAALCAFAKAMKDLGAEQRGADWLEAAINNPEV